MPEQTKDLKKNPKTVFDRSSRAKMFGNSPLSSAGKRLPDTNTQETKEISGVYPSKDNGQYLT